MKKKKIIIYSSIIVLIVLTIILFTTYAFITTKVSGNSSGKKYQAISKIIRIEYSDGKETLSSNINDTFTPGSVITKTFTVTNTGDDEIDYTIFLENVTNTFTRYNDITYELYDSSNTKIYEGIFPKTDNTISDTYKLKKNESTTYTLKVIYNNSEENQIVDSGKKIDAKISFVKTTLKNAILASAKTAASSSDATRTTMGSTVTEFTSISGTNEHVLNNAPDDYGTSYYYRGNVIDNYVTFANKIWRIVRINGDGTVRLILNDVAKDSSGNKIITAFNTSYNDNAYVGYMYGLTGQNTVKNQCIKLNSAGTAAEVDTTITTESACTSAGYKWTTTPYDATHTNVVSSTVKKSLDTWYETNIKNNGLENYLADTLFCNDKTLASSTIGSGNTTLGYGTNNTYYASTERLLYSKGTSTLTTVKPTFKCAESATNDYSRFTVDVATLSNGNKTNGNLTYPIGLLTFDELSFAGAYEYGYTNESYYLYNSSITSYWWLSSPFRYYNSSADEKRVFWSSGSINSYSVGNTRGISFRPSINLKTDLLVDGGDGTKSNPYFVR